MDYKNKIVLLLEHTLILIVAGMVMISCGGKQPKPEPQWTYKPQGIEISYHADNMLNEFNGSSHALQVVFYQFDDINKFIELSEYKDGLIKLLKAQNFDPSVQALKKIFIDPGEEGKIVLDRAEKSRWVGIVAGFFDLTPGRVTTFFEIPHKVEKQGFVFKNQVAVIFDLKADILFAKHDIKKIKSNEN